ncbi:MAG: hypothetical protein PF795_11140 [Kiritimatiellae bacterium]|nr:hypothetical protein [Kiritimatiellia bacterium]
MRDLQVTNSKLQGSFQGFSGALLSATQLTIALVGAWIILTFPDRLSTVRDVDELLVMEDGRLVEHGPYETLKDTRGAFAELLHEQRLGEDPDAER